jgi:hypothetical protein
VHENNEKLTIDNTESTIFRAAEASSLVPHYKRDPSPGYDKASSANNPDFRRFPAADGQAGIRQSQPSTT